MINSVLSSLPLYMHDVLFCNSNNIGADEIRLLSLRFFFGKMMTKRESIVLSNEAYFVSQKIKGG